MLDPLLKHAENRAGPRGLDRDRGDVDARYYAQVGKNPLSELSNET